MNLDDLCNRFQQGYLAWVKECSANGELLKFKCKLCTDTKHEDWALACVCCLEIVCLKCANTCAWTHVMKTIHGHNVFSNALKKDVPKKKERTDNQCRDLLNRVKKIIMGM